jgi:predicted metalloprotease with PDZ domain
MKRRTGLLACALGVAWSAAAIGAPAPIVLRVDATDAPRGVFRAKLTIPAAPGPLTLAYPKWIQGEHAPSGPIAQLAGLAIFADGKRLAWRRDPLDMFLFQVEVPRGAGSLEVSLDYLSPPESFWGSPGYGETPNSSPHLAIVDWHDEILYPRGRSAREIPVRASLRLPTGWKFATSLPVERQENGTVEFRETTVDGLIDAPVLAGEYFRRIRIEAGEAPVYLDLAADEPSALDVPAALLEGYRKLPGQARAVFGARHYRHYDWLVALSDPLEVNGLEHHESTDIRDHVSMFLDPQRTLVSETVVPHEYVHSWNGKFRRPAGLVRPDPNEPLDTSLLWVYEGLTRYLGDFVLAARSGIRTPEETRDYFAFKAANLDQADPGRLWRPLADTAASAQIIYPAPAAWRSLRRHADFYDEMMLVWLDADTIIRRQTRGAASLDDFCRRFLGGEDTGPELRSYTEQDVEALLSKIAPYDWTRFFRERVHDIAPRAPLAGLEAAGWKLVYDARPNLYQEAYAHFQDSKDARFSLGVMADKDGRITDIVVGSPAWTAGLGPGMNILSVGGRSWDETALRDAIRASAGAGSSAPIEVVAKTGDALRTFQVISHTGERHPHLERIPGRPDVLSEILAPKPEKP